MRKFLVNVNGTSYEVEVEELKGDVKPAAIPRSRRASARSCRAWRCGNHLRAHARHHCRRKR